MKFFNVPGVAWVAAITGLVTFIQTYFPDQPWASGVVIVLAMILKGLQMMMTPAIGPTPTEIDLRSGLPLPSGTVARDSDVKVVEAPKNGVVRLLLGP